MLSKKLQLLCSFLGGVAISIAFFYRHVPYNLFLSTSAVDITVAIGTLLSGVGAFALIPFTVYWYKITKDKERASGEVEQLKAILVALGDNATTTLGALVSSSSTMFGDNNAFLRKVPIESGPLSALSISDLSKVAFSDVAIMNEVIAHARSQAWLYETVQTYNGNFEQATKSTGEKLERITSDTLLLYASLIDNAIEIALDFADLMEKLSKEFHARENKTSISTNDIKRKCLALARVSERIRTNIDRFVHYDPTKPEILPSERGMVIAYNESKTIEIPIAAIANPSYFPLFAARHKAYGKAFIEEARQKMLLVFFEKVAPVVLNAHLEQEQKLQEMSANKPNNLSANTAEINDKV